MPVCAFACGTAVVTQCAAPQWLPRTFIAAATIISACTAFSGYICTQPAQTAAGHSTGRLHDHLDDDMHQAQSSRAREQQLQLPCMPLLTQVRHKSRSSSSWVRLACTAASHAITTNLVCLSACLMKGAATPKPHAAVSPSNQHPLADGNQAVTPPPTPPAALLASRV